MADKSWFNSHRKRRNKPFQNRSFVFELSTLRLSQSKQHLGWLTGHCCWMRLDVASLPGLHCFQESSVPSSFYFFNVRRVCGGHIPWTGDGFYSSCAVCPTLSWRDRKADLEKYFVYVIGDYRTAASALCLGLAESCPEAHRVGVGLNNAVPWGWRYTPRVLAQGLPSWLDPCDSWLGGQGSSCGETGEEAPPGCSRRPFATFSFFVPSKRNINGRTLLNNKYF